jgi:type IV secretory pathway protease TraF
MPALSNLAVDPPSTVRSTRLFTKLSRLLADPSIDRMSIKIDGSAFSAGRRQQSAVREDAMKLRVCGLLVIAASALAVCQPHAAPGQVWVVSGYTQRSLDSRYFGPVLVSAVQGAAQPLWTIR